MTNTCPPDMPTNMLVVASGGHELTWMSHQHTRYYTNAFILHDGKLLLGYKKRGFGKGYYNGFGGKVEPGETSQQAALRELQEEAGITAELVHAGTLVFCTEGVNWAFHIDIYRGDAYSGEITETDEMRPEWFSATIREGNNDDDDSLRRIPIDMMWESDQYWIPLLVTKRRFYGRTDFRRDGDKDILVKWWFGVDE